jgi:hypothetical protein
MASFDDVKGDRYKLTISGFGKLSDMLDARAGCRAPMDRTGSVLRNERTPLRHSNR